MEKKSLSASAEQPAASPKEAEAPPAAPAVAAPAAPAYVDNTIHVEGVLDIDIVKGGNGQLLDMAKNGKRRPTDTFVPKELIRRFKLKSGSLIGGTAFPPEGRFPNPKMRYIEMVDGMTLEERRSKLDFAALTTVSPDKHLKLEMKDGRMTTRAVDLFCPIGKGTRGLIVAPPRTGKTILLRDMALGILENNPECHVMILLVDERPRRSPTSGAACLRRSGPRPTTSRSRTTSGSPTSASSARSASSRRARTSSSSSTRSRASLAPTIP